MKDKIKGFIVGMIVSMTIISTGVLATNGAIKKELWYNNIKIMLNNKEIKPTDASGNYVEPFTIDGTTYLPVRAVASSLGLNVEWDGSTNTVKLYENNNLLQDSKYDKVIAKAKEIASIYATVYPNMVRDILIDDFSFTDTQAQYALYHTDINWNWYAEIHAKDYILISNENGQEVSIDDVIDYLSTEKGYLWEQIEHALSNNDVLNVLNSQQITYENNDDGYVEYVEPKIRKCNLCSVEAYKVNGIQYYYCYGHICHAPNCGQQAQGDLGYCSTHISKYLPNY